MRGEKVGEGNWMLGSRSLKGLYQQGVWNEKGSDLPSATLHSPALTLTLFLQLQDPAQWLTSRIATPSPVPILETCFYTVLSTHPFILKMETAVWLEHRKNFNIQTQIQFYTCFLYCVLIQSSPKHVSHTVFI
jgi:hypothetical protein